LLLFLHDNISVYYHLQECNYKLYQSNTKFPAEITKTKQILENAHDQVRDLSHELMPSLLVRFGLFDALESMKKIQTRY
jgi:signal transduction histidine kinase